MATFMTLDELEQTDLVVHLREKLDSSEKTIAHFSRAHRVLVERVQMLTDHNSELRRIIGSLQHKVRRW